MMPSQDIIAVCNGVQAGHHCVVFLDKLLRPVCLCYQAVYFGTGEAGDLSGWESKHGPGGK